MSDENLCLIVDSFLDRMWDDFVVGRQDYHCTMHSIEVGKNCGRYKAQLMLDQVKYTSLVKERRLLHYPHALDRDRYEGQPKTR